VGDVIWPKRVRISASPARLLGRVRSRSRAISGAETLVPSLTSWWEVNLSVAVVEEDARLEWEAWLAGMRGGLATCAVPMHMSDRVGYLSRDGEAGQGVAEFTSHEHWIFDTSSEDRITLAQSAALRATDLPLDLGNAERPRPGHRLSIADRMHRVALSWETDGGAIMVRVDPPLRSAHSAGTPVDVDQITCLMRLADEGEGEIEDVPGAVQRFTVRLVEAL